MTIDTIDIVVWGMWCWALALLLRWLWRRMAEGRRADASARRHDRAVRLAIDAAPVVRLGLLDAMAEFRRRQIHVGGYDESMYWAEAADAIEHLLECVPERKPQPLTTPTDGVS